MENRNQSLMPGVTFGTRDKTTGRVDWTAPNSGRYPIAHIDTFLNRYTSLASVYRDYDEALLDDRDNARYMRNDVGIRECLDSRQRSVALLNWHIEPENDSSTDQREFCALLESICRRISHFTEYRRNCQHAIWYGKYAIQHRWGAQIVAGRSIWMPTPRHQDDWGWRPLNGDKLVFRQKRSDRPMEPGSYEGQVGIRVGNSHKAGDVLNGRWKVEPTDYGLGYFLSPAERRLLLIHKHHVEDATYEDGLRAGSIYGVGIRSVIYWEWIQKQQTLSFLMEFLERMSGGIQIWKYPQGNLQAHNEAKAAAEGFNSGQQHILLVPVPIGDEGQYGVEVIDPGFNGVETLHSLLTDFFGHRVKRYILGQVLSSESAATGLGSGVADLHMDTLLQILKSDATNLEETLTTDLLESIVRVNVQKGVWQDPGFRPRFVIETEEPDVDKKLQSWCQLLDRGLPIRKSDLYEMIGAAMPGPNDAVLSKQGKDEANPAPAGAAHPTTKGNTSQAHEEAPPHAHEKESDRNRKGNQGPFQKSTLAKGIQFQGRSGQ